MGIKRFFNRTVVVRRLRDISGSSSGLVATATVDCNIQTIDRVRRQELEIVTGQAWEAFFELEDGIQEGDKLTDDRGVIYKVLEVTRLDVGINQHLACVLVEYNA